MIDHSTCQKILDMRIFLYDFLRKRLLAIKAAVLAIDLTHF